MGLHCSHFFSHLRLTYNISRLIEGSTFDIFFLLQKKTNVKYEPAVFSNGQQVTTLLVSIEVCLYVSLWENYPNFHLNLPTIPCDIICRTGRGPNKQTAGAFSSTQKDTESIFIFPRSTYEKTSSNYICALEPSALARYKQKFKLCGLQDCPYGLISRSSFCTLVMAHGFQEIIFSYSNSWLELQSLFFTRWLGHHWLAARSAPWNSWKCVWKNTVATDEKSLYVRGPTTCFCHLIRRTCWLLVCTVSPARDMMVDKCSTVTDMNVCKCITNRLEFQLQWCSKCSGADGFSFTVMLQQQT